MSWERVHEKILRAKCACGNGYVEKKEYTEMDDWNRYQDGVDYEEIKCEICKSKYHIEHFTYHNGAPKWKSDGMVDFAYLVSNGETFHKSPSITLPHLTFDEHLVAHYTKQELLDAVDDMRKSKYSTRVTLSQSKDIVYFWKCRYKKHNLTLIINYLEKVIDKYDNYLWPVTKYLPLSKKYDCECDIVAKDNDVVRKGSFLLDYKIASED